jgi:hypothetical protein
MAGPAAALLSKMDPTQISIVVEALGKSCTKDAELYGKISSQVRFLTSNEAGGRGRDGFLCRQSKQKRREKEDPTISRMRAAFHRRGLTSSPFPPAMQVVANIGKFSGADLARTLWGFAAAHVEDGAMAKAVCKALVDKAADLSGKEATQVRGMKGGRTGGLSEGRGGCEREDC